MLWYELEDSRTTSFWPPWLFAFPICRPPFSFYPTQEEYWVLVSMLLVLSCVKFYSQQLFLFAVTYFICSNFFYLQKLFFICGNFFFFFSNIFYLYRVYTVDLFYVVTLVGHRNFWLSFCHAVTLKDNLWVSVTHSLGIEINSFVDRHQDSIIDMIVSGNTFQQVSFPLFLRS